MVSKLGFIFGTTLFFLFVVNVTALGASTFIEGFAPQATLNTETIGIVEFLLFVIQNVTIFISLIAIGSTWGLFSAIVLTSYSVAMIWAILELIRGV